MCCFEMPQTGVGDLELQRDPPPPPSPHPQCLNYDILYCEALYKFYSRVNLTANKWHCPRHVFLLNVIIR